MIRTKDIKYVRGNFSVGQKIKCLKPTSGDKWIQVEARIIGKFPQLALMEFNGQKWCIKWIDFIMQGLQ